MGQLGQYNTLKVVKQVEFGVYLQDDTFGEVLLPKSQVPPAIKDGDDIEVFLYKDSEDRPIATCKEPLATLGEFAVLKVRMVDKVGAWLDWGLDKDLLVPFREQKQDMEADKSYLVFLYLDDESQRIVASTKLEKFLNNTPPEYEVGQEVDILISNQSEIGYTAIINQAHSGLLYKNEVFQKIRRGSHYKAYIKKLREDDKIDLSLLPLGYEKIDSMAKQLLQELKESGGSLPLNDKSSPEDIYNSLKMSKKNFKKAVGSLYKERIIVIEEKGIRLA